MKRVMFLLFGGAIFSGVAAFAAMAPAMPEISLTRLDCGQSNGPRDVSGFSDTGAYPYPKIGKALVASCYVIRHGDDVMVWDTGYPADVEAQSKGSTLMKATLATQLKALNIDPAAVKYVGISHYHGDHTGQLAQFTGATLLIGKGDWEAVTAATPAPGVNAAPFARWIKDGGTVEPLARDKDVFGDGSVVVLDTPGHTPGHKSLLVRLKTKGNVLLTGDLSHFQENYDTNGVPSFNTNRADTLASLDRFKKMATNLDATVIIQHEPADAAKLPTFPQGAR